MSEARRATIERIHRAVAHIEHRLGERITVADAARAACYSPYHFHRTFSALTGETVMEYVRRRRLTIAARALCATERPIVAIALDAVFESQEAFTRAFRAQFGTTPGRYRRSGGHSTVNARPAWTLEALMLTGGGVPMEATYVERPEMRVVGLSGRYRPGATDGIPALWQDMVTRWSAAGRPFPPVCFGVCFDEGDCAAEENPAFTYMAAFETTDDAPAPEGFELRTVPANRYAVFTHRGPIVRIGETYRRIFGEWLPGSGLTRAEGPDFELYDERFDPATMGGEVDIYVPVAEA